MIAPTTIVTALIEAEKSDARAFINAHAADGRWARDIVIAAIDKGLSRVNAASEAIIAKSGLWSLRYAQQILQGPFPLGEPAMKRADPWVWLDYQAMLRDD